MLKASRFQGQELGKSYTENSNRPNYALALTRFNRYQLPRLCLSSAKGNLQIRLHDVFKTGVALGTSYTLSLYSYTPDKEHENQVMKQLVLKKLQENTISRQKEDLVFEMKQGAYLIEVRVAVLIQ